MPTDMHAWHTFFRATSAPFTPPPQPSHESTCTHTTLAPNRFARSTATHTCVHAALILPGGGVAHGAAALQSMGYNGRAPLKPLSPAAQGEEQALRGCMLALAGTGPHVRDSISQVVQDLNSRGFQVRPLPAALSHHGLHACVRTREQCVCSPHRWPDHRSTQHAAQQGRILAPPQMSA